MIRVLAIDDLRDIPGADCVARTAQEGIKQLQENGPWDLLYLDHDLASYDETGKEITGYDILCWLEQNTEFMPRKITLVSANPVGTEKMQAAINSILRKTKDDK